MAAGDAQQGDGRQTPYGQTPYEQNPHSQDPYAQYPQGGWGPQGPGAPPPPGYGAGAPGSWPGGPGYAPYLGPPPAPRPGVIPLRPLGLSDILSGVFAIVRGYAKQIYGLTFALLGSALVVCALAAGIGAAVVWGTISDVFRDVDNPYADGGQTATLVITAVLVGIVWVLVGLYTVSALHAVNAVAASHAVTGQQATAGQMWRQARPRVLSVTGTQVLTGLLIGALMLVGYGSGVGIVLAMFVGAASQDSGGLAVLGGLGLVATVLGLGAAAAFFYIRFSLAPSAAVLEGFSSGSAMGRSWRLVHGSWWRVFGISLLMGLLVAVIDTALQYAITFIGVFGMAAALSGGGEPSVGVAFTALGVILATTVLASVLTVPFGHLTRTLLYVDMRIRNEGFDLNLAAAAGLPPHRPAP